LRLVNGGLDFVAIGGKTRDGPGAGGFGDEAFNELRTAGVAEIGFLHRAEGWQGRVFLSKACEEFPGGDWAIRNSPERGNEFLREVFRETIQSGILLLEKSSQSRLGIGTARGAISYRSKRKLSEWNSTFCVSDSVRVTSTYVTSMVVACAVAGVWSLPAATGK